MALGLTAIVFLLSRYAEFFVGDSLPRSVLTFALVILALGVATAAFLRGWTAFRSRTTRLGGFGLAIAPTLAVAALIGSQSAWWNRTAQADLRRLQAVIGGPAEAERAAIAHQVFAHYRRADLDELRVILERSVVFAPTILEAAEAVGVDSEILMGIAATESSFLPRPSRDGGQGLFQITKPPADAIATTKRLLSTDHLDPVNQRHNAFLGATTYRAYLAQMRGDLFLGLLAYNIGPHNGGLRAIMEQYGARDFVTIQPYLQTLPRDYPIRVLTAALAYRVWRHGGTLPRYEEGANATYVQNIGIPGLAPRRSLSLIGLLMPD